MSMTNPLPIGAVPPIGVSPPPVPLGGGGGGGGADAVAMITGATMNNPVMIRLNIAFFIIYCVYRFY
jgi:hypothetical protein